MSGLWEEHIKRTWFSLKNLCCWDACKTILKALIQQPVCWNISAWTPILSHGLFICIYLSCRQVIHSLYHRLNAFLCFCVTFQNWLFHNQAYRWNCTKRNSKYWSNLTNSVINSPSQLLSWENSPPLLNYEKNSSETSRKRNFPYLCHKELKVKVKMRLYQGIRILQCDTLRSNVWLSCKLIFCI